LDSDVGGFYFQTALTRFKVVVEELQLHRRDLASRWARKLRERVAKPAEGVMTAMRERHRRNRRHKLAGAFPGIMPPRKVLSTRIRAR
jgi:hypothetical protein